MDEMGLTRFLQDFDTFAGPMDHAADVLRKLEAMGVSTVIAALPRHADPLVTIRGLADAIVPLPPGITGKQAWLDRQQWVADEIMSAI